MERLVRPLALAAFAISLAACGAASTASAPVAHARPVGPTASYLYTPHAFVLRIECAAIRATPIASNVSAVWQTAPLFARLARGASFDPIRDLDAMVTTAASIDWSPGPAASRWRIVLRHHRDAASARAMLGAMGAPVVWREGQGMPSALLPSEIAYVTPHAIALTAFHEAVIAPDDELGVILTAARDQAARRNADADVIEPGLAAPPGELVRVETVPPPPLFASFGATAARGALMRAGQGAAIHLEFDFPSTTLAQAVATQVGTTLPILASNALVVGFGLGRPLATAQIATHASSVTIDTTATFDELSAMLSAIAMVSGDSI